MQDCHALRRARGVAASAALRAGHCPVTAALAAWPDAADADAAREWAAIARSDTVLVCSPVEHAWLIKTLGVPPAKLVLAPLFARTRARPTAALPLSHRAGFVSVGSFLHPPNVEGLAWYLDAPDGWRSLRAELGKERAQLDICGSYAHERQAVTAALHRPALGVHVRGHAPNLSPIARARVLLAPLTYGAGLKGKLIDAWRRGTPAVTTPIGSEGLRVEDWKQLEDGTPGAVPPPAALHDITGWGGASDCVTPADITAAAVRLATDDTAWHAAQGAGYGLHNALCVGGGAPSGGRGRLCGRHPPHIPRGRFCRGRPVGSWDTGHRVLLSLDRAQGDGARQRSGGSLVFFVCLLLQSPNQPSHFLLFLVPRRPRCRLK